MKLVRAGDPDPPIQTRHFTGKPNQARRLEEQQLAGMRVAKVTFGPRDRTFWHLHHGEQLLYVLSGTGWVQKEGEEPLEIHPGDLVYVAPRENHWHGATATDSMQHLAVTIGETEWGEEVSDQDYPPPQP
jgi:quercetin dioxygenase-like cupin family protein